MKPQFKTIAPTGAAILASFGVLTGCGQNAPATATAENPANAAQTAFNNGHAHKTDAHGGAGHATEGGHTHTTKLVVASQPEKVQAGQKAKWTLKVVDDLDNTPISDFEIVHDKLLHLIVVSKDLKWFNHLHPEHQGNGVFEIETALPRAGSYKLYADYKPKERDGEVAQHAFSVGGANALPATPTLIADTMRGGWMTKTVTAAPEGEPDKTGGARYQVALMPMPARIEAGKDLMLHFQVRDAAGKPVQLQPYLGAQGHLVLLSADSNTYLHTHPTGGDHAEGAHGDAGKGDAHGETDHGSMKHDAAAGGSDVMFHTQFPKAGVYKAWGQFRHNDQIITASFVLRATEAKAASAQPVAAKSSAVTSTGGVQRATVNIDGVYAPAKLTVKVGQPVELTFVRKEKAGCGDMVQIPALKLKTKSLKPGEKATLKFTPMTAQTLRFTCSMDMYNGSISVVK